MKWILFEMCSRIEIKFWICKVKDIKVFLEMAVMPKGNLVRKKIICITR